MPASGCNCPLCQVLRNAISHHVNPATQTSSTSVAELNSSLVVNTSGVSSPLLVFAPRKTGSGQLVSVPSSVEKRKRKPASRDIEPQRGFPHVHDSFHQLRPAGSGAVAPARQPGPQRRPRDVPVHAGQGRPRPRRTHPDGSLVRAARPECRKTEAPGAGRSERPSEHVGAWIDGAIAERRQVGDTGGRQCQAQGRRTPDGQARRVQPAA